MILRASRRIDDELKPLPYVKSHVSISTTSLVVIAGAGEVAVSIRHGADIAMEDVAAPALVPVLEAREAVALGLAGDQALLDCGAAGVPVHGMVVQCSDVVFCTRWCGSAIWLWFSGGCGRTDDQQWLSTIVHSRVDAV